KLKQTLSNMGVSSLEIDFKVGDFTKKLEEQKNYDKESLIKLHKRLEEEQEQNRSQIKSSPNSKKVDSKKENPNVQKFQTKNRGLNGTPITIDEFFSELQENEICLLEGEIFAIETRELRTEKTLAVIRITDMKNSVTLKAFLDKGKNLEVKVGDYVKASGRKQVDRYANNEEGVLITAIEKQEISKKIKKDNSEKKMVELHTHSKMSEMVGVTDIKDIINQALNFGHNAVAITDYGVVHSFPFAYKEAKGKDIKVIMGCEIAMVDDERAMVLNSRDVEIEEETYVVFDLETTGLSSHKCEITEIGAVKLKGTRIVDTYSKFVKPEGKIPDKIVALTGITEEMVRDADAIDKVLPEFLEFVGDAVLVAHNAPFDMSFMRRDAEKFLGKKIKNPVIDTLRMARDLYPNQKGHGLKAMSKLLGVGLESHHRAVDDSQATANMFIIFLEKYKEIGAKSLLDLEGGFPINLRRQDSKNVMILAQNRVGLKNLYELISEAHINLYGDKKPKISKKLLKSLREGLLIGSSMTA
ncbi:MAG: exonuclease domain-containing protein, partial [Fusobacteriaceae bacterium]